jgi:hypothetical protein
MFERLGRFAETVATHAGETRRGFLGRLSTGALGLAGVVGGLLLFPGEAAATVCTGACHYFCPDGTPHATNCGSGCGCDESIEHAGMICLLYRESCGYR